jgi:hypothetical protein
MTARPAIIRDRSVELALGALLFVAGAWLIHDAYEGRDKKRPFLASVVLP